MNVKKKIAILASGAGSNANLIIEKSKLENSNYEVILVVSSKATAGVLAIAEKYDIESITLDKDIFFNQTDYISFLQKKEIELIVLAGFLWKVPEQLVAAFPNQIINIHPALLPKYGGKGMYGMHVHQAVVNNKETETGITIHYVNEQYDEGKTILQAKCTVLPTDDATTVANKVHQLEYEHFWKTINQLTQ